MTKSAPTDGHGHVIGLDNLAAVFFLRKYPRRPHRDPQKLVFPYKPVCGGKGDHNWLKVTSDFILFEFFLKLSKIIQRKEKDALSQEHVSMVSGQSGLAEHLSCIWCKDHMFLPLHTMKVLWQVDWPWTGHLSHDHMSVNH